MRRGATLAAAAAVMIAAFAPAPAGAQANRFDYDEPAIRALRYAAWEAGTLFGSAAAPYTLADVRLTLGRTDRSLARNPGSLESSLALMRLSWLSDAAPDPDDMGLGASIGADAAFEAYPRLYESGDAGTPWPWSERAALLRLPVSFSALGVFYARAAIELREDHNAVELDVVPANWSNWIESGDYIDYAFPFESFASAEYGPLSASVGRDRLRWGPGATGTLVLSDAPDHYDYLDAGITGDWFAYRFMRVSLDPSVTAAELAALPDTFVSAKNLFLHRFEFLFGGRVAFALTEGLMVGGVEPDLSYANPFLVLHNMWAWNRTKFDGIPDNDMTSAASILGAELRVNPWRFVELYGSFAMNQLQTDYERSRYGGAAATIPNAYAWQAGADAAYPFMGGWIRATAEYVFTNPWMYVRENSLNSFIWRRVLPSNVSADGKSSLASAPIGYRYGPDSRVFFCSLGWDAPGALSFAASAEYAERGEQTIESAYHEGEAAVELTTPTGIPERTASVTLESSWSPRAGVSLYGAFVFRHIENSGHLEGQTASAMDALVGISVSFPGALR